jgi:excisionase family DNA binding protein
VDASGATAERLTAPSEQLLTADELAARWQVELAHVYRLTRRGEIPAVKLGRYYRYHPDAIRRFELGEHAA